MPEFIDQLGRSVSLYKVPKRIVSLVPSQTEMLYHWGVEPVGQTLFCVHPENKYKTSSKVGGTKKVNLEKVLELKPDLVIGNKEENDPGQIRVLSKAFPVWLSDVKTLDDAYAMMRMLGTVLDKGNEAEKLIYQIQESWQGIATFQGRVAYAIWRDPWMFVGQNTFIQDVIRRLGWFNVLENRARYPKLKLSDLSEYRPEIVLLSSEPYPFKKEHEKELKKSIPGVKVLHVDGELFSWYGSRLLKSPEYFQTLLGKL